MLCAITTPHTMSEDYKDLVDRVNTGEIEDVCRDINELCKECQPTSPMMCIELCQLWELKRQFRDAFLAVSKKLSLSNLLNSLKNEKRLQIMKILSQRPCSLRELREELAQKGHYLSSYRLRERYLKPLIDTKLITEEDDHYTITSTGHNAYNVVTASEVSKLSVHSDEHEEQLLQALLEGPKTYDALATEVPREALQRSLRRLQRRSLIDKDNLSGHTFYYRAKRRPTRKLTPRETTIFKALPKEGIVVKALSEKVGLSVSTVYNYLRRLKYKRHVKTGNKPNLYKLTETGKQLAQSLNTLRHFIQN